MLWCFSTFIVLLFFVIMKKTGHCVNFGPAVAHLLSAGFTEKWNTIKHLIQARYEVLTKEEKDVGGSKNGDNEETSQTMSSFLDKDLDAALDSFDNLFCRRCLVSDLSCICHIFLCAISFYCSGCLFIHVFAGFWLQITWMFSGSCVTGKKLTWNYFSWIFYHLFTSILSLSESTSYSSLLIFFIRWINSLHGAKPMKKIYHVVLVVTNRYAFSMSMLCF